MPVQCLLGAIMCSFWWRSTSRSEKNVCHHTLSIHYRRTSLSWCFWKHLYQHFSSWRYWCNYYPAQIYTWHTHIQDCDFEFWICGTFVSFLFNVGAAWIFFNFFYTRIRIESHVCSHILCLFNSLTASHRRSPFYGMMMRRTHQLQKRRVWLLSTFFVLFIANQIHRTYFIQFSYILSLGISTVHRSAICR